MNKKSRSNGQWRHTSQRWEFQSFVSQWRSRDPSLFFLSCIFHTTGQTNNPPIFFGALFQRIKEKTKQKMLKRINGMSCWWSDLHLHWYTRRLRRVPRQHDTADWGSAESFTPLAARYFCVWKIAPLGEQRIFGSLIRVWFSDFAPLSTKGRVIERSHGTAVMTSPRWHWQIWPQRVAGGECLGTVKWATKIYPLNLRKGTL